MKIQPAFVAPSNGISENEGQGLIKQRIDSLVEKELCVKVPQYKDGLLAVESEVIGRKTSNRMGTTISPATSNESGASQIIDCIANGWNIMPWMGGDNFENKIPITRTFFFTSSGIRKIIKRSGNRNLFTQHNL
jgi:hypothetical protein